MPEGRTAPGTGDPLSNDQDRTILDALAQGVVVRDSALRVRYLNPAARRILRIAAAEEIEPEPLGEWEIFAEDGSPVSLPIRQVAAEGVSWSGLLFRVHAPGQPDQWLSSEARPIVLADGSTGSLSVFTDVSDQVEARRAAEDNELRFRLIAENANDVMWRNSLNGTLLWVSSSVRRVLGWKPQDLVGRQMVDLVHPDDRPVAVRARFQAQAGQPSSADLRFQHKDGSWTPMGVTAGPFLDADGQVTGTFASARDTSSQRSSELRLAESERRFRLLADLGDTLSALDSVEELAQRAADFLSRQLADACTISLLNDSRTRITPVAASHQDAAAGQALRDLLGHDPVPLADSVSGTAAVTRQSIILSELSVDPQSSPQARALDRYIADHGIGSVLMSPLVAHDEIIGSAILMRDPGGEPFGPRERELVEEVSRRLATAIDEAQLRADARAAQQALSASEQRFRMAMENAPIGMAIVSLDGYWLEVNQALCEITGYDSDDLRHMNFQHITHPDDLESDLGLLQQLLAGEIPNYRLYKRYVRKDGRTVWIELQVSLVRSPEGDPLYFISQILDVDAARRAQEQLEYQATHDLMTGLLNRPELVRTLTGVLTNHRDPGPWSAVLFCDIDHFKAVNDTLGHAGGDDVLTAVADRMRQRVRSGDAVARIGGDEFVVVLHAVRDEAEVRRIAEEIRARVGRPIPIRGRAEPFSVTMSIGVAVVAHGADPERALQAADLQLYEAKRSGRNRTSVGATPLLPLSDARS